MAGGDYYANGAARNRPGPTRPVYRLDFFIPGIYTFTAITMNRQ